MMSFAPSRVMAQVIAQSELAPRHFRLRLRAPEIARLAQPGQFAHVLPRDAEGCDPLLRRAFSFLWAGADEFEILYRAGGRGTRLMSHFVSGDAVDVIGPLGQGFAPLAQQSWLVGGGVGVPPLAMLASRRVDRDVQEMFAFVGARTGEEVLCLADFAAAGVEVEVATDDGTMGHHGRVTQPLEDRLQALAPSDIKPVVYACGPWPMLRAVAALCAQHDVRCQVSLEENMPCGVGVCNGCVVPVRMVGDEYGRYRRICMDGPVLWADEVDWDASSL